MSSPGMLGPGDFTSSSSNYVPAKISFLKWLQEEAQERGYDPELDRYNRVLYERPLFAVRTRASVQQRSPFKFKVNDEVNADVSAFQNAYSVVLDLHSPYDFDSSLDDFYPLTLTYYRVSTNQDKNGDYPIGIYLDDKRVNRYKNSVDYLFPPNDSGIEDSESGSGPDDFGDWRNQMSDQTRRLNDIAQNLTQE